ncbi:Peptidase M13, N-terminal domain and Metallopeptidase, catalytic domain-containing protein [Strongyloides ratti]|uniref:Peptidase M13, N-terminal domain and Metallopeptidase, catalytic domain-containing protein n=1 Tax=Strongyloides ratti TaxID=34506 RepID=A0A090L1T0_STRRB|nr:Peptidase M13, N-terminal domain and Metallopeptidase, catalytic domain-containing protein [Strongyloides ratti]CEF63741.1 Peptidase M13, N-terminal domain and Metallopeptidase, catalytic domain-containing protein [Strongyloides ratti]
MSNLPSPVFSNDNECHVITLENEPYNRSQCTSPDGFSFTRPRSVTIIESDEVDIKKNKKFNGILKNNSNSSIKPSNDTKIDNPNSVVSFQNRYTNIPTINQTIKSFLNFLKNYKCIILLIIFIILILSVIGLSISLGIITPLSKLYCTSKACISSATRLSEYINRNDDICKNPYNVICGNTQEWNYEDKDTIFLTKFNNKPQYFIETIKIIYNKILNILNNPSNDNDSLPFKISKTLYDGCMNNELRKIQGMEPLKELLKTLPCGSILNECTSFNSTNYSLETNIGLYGFYAGNLNIIYYDKDIDPDYDGKVILSFAPPDLTTFLNPYRRQIETTEFDNPNYRKNLLMFAIKNVYKEYITNILNNSKFNDNQIEEVAKFTLELENFTTTMDSYNTNFKVLTIDDLKLELGSFDIMTFLDTDISNKNTWNGTNRVLINNIDYFKHLNFFLKTFKLETIANYLTITSTINLAKYTSNLNTDNDVWEKCIDDMLNLESTITLYNNRYGVKISNEENIQKILLKMQNFYIDTHTTISSELIQKVRTMKIQVGVPPQIRNKNFIDDIYSNVHLNSSDYFSTMLRILKRQRDYRILNIGSVIDSRDNVHWNILYPEITYDEHENTIFVPLAILKIPIFDGNYNDNWITISSLGFLYFQKLSNIIWNSPYETGYKEQFINCLTSKSSIGSFGSSAPKIGINTLQNTDSLQTLMKFMLKNGYINENNKDNFSNIPGFSDYSFYELAILQSSTFTCYKKDPLNFIENVIQEQIMYNSLNEMNIFSTTFNCSEE